MMYMYEYTNTQENFFFNLVEVIEIMIYEKKNDYVKVLDQ